MKYCASLSAPASIALAFVLLAWLQPIHADAAFIVEAAAGGKAVANFSSALPTRPSATNVISAGVTPGIGSVFGSNPTATEPEIPDPYTFTYTPGSDADNTVYSSGEVLGNSEAIDVDGAGSNAPVYLNTNQIATGVIGGASGLYNVYYTTAESANVDSAGSQFVITGDGPSIVLNPVDQNIGGTGPDTGNAAPAYAGGANNMWLKLGTVALTAGNSYTVSMTANNSSAFVSQRAHGVMWEFVGVIVPEPSAVFLAGLALFGALLAGRRRAN